MPLISVVDDDRCVVEATVSLLESVGYDASGFVSAEEFLTALRFRETSCLIVDVRMPGMGGIELQRRLAAENNRTPIIFISANGDDGSAARALRGGAVAFLHKPFSQDALLGAVRTALGQCGGANQTEVKASNTK